MSWFDRFKFKKQADNQLFQAFMGFIHNGEIAWIDGKSSAYIKEGYCSNEHIFSAVRVILNKIKVAPFMVSEIVSSKHATLYDQYSRKSDSTSAIRAVEYRIKAFRELETHDLKTLLNNPNDYQTRSQFLESLEGYYKTLGETFVYGIPIDMGLNKGKFQSLHVLPAHLVEPVYSGNPYFPIRGYKFLFGDQSVEIPKDYVFHWKTWNPNWDISGRQLRGLSPMEPGKKLITRNNANQKAQTKAFFNGGSAYLLSNAGDKPGALTQEQIDLLNERIKEKIKGPENYMSITATSGIVNVERIGDSPADLKLLESDKADRSKAAALVGVDPILIGDKGSSSYNNQEQAYKALVTNTILPDMVEFREGFNMWLAPKYGENLYIDFDTTVFPELQPDLKLMSDIYGKPLLTENEKRSIFNWDALPDQNMNKVYIEKNRMPLDQMNKTADAVGGGK